MCQVIDIRDGIKQIIAEQVSVISNEFKYIGDLTSDNEMSLLDTKSHLIRCNLKAKEGRK